MGFIGTFGFDRLGSMDVTAKRLGVRRTPRRAFPMKSCLTLVSTLLVGSSDMPVLAGRPEASIVAPRTDAQAARAGTFNVAGRTIRYVEYGRGMATILVRGGFAQSEPFQKQIPALAANFRVVIFETIDQHADEQDDRAALMPADVEALLRHLDIRRGDVVSFSDAGLVGLHLASQPLDGATAEGLPRRPKSAARERVLSSSRFVQRDGWPALEGLTQP